MKEGRRKKDYGQETADSKTPHGKTAERKASERGARRRTVSNRLYRQPYARQGCTLHQPRILGGTDVKTLDTSMGGDQRGFPPTPALLKTAGPVWAEAMDLLSRVYWKPVYLYIRTMWGNTNEDAKDLAQQFFLHVMKNQAVERYRPSRAAFRTYIKACLKNFLLDESRRRESLKSGGDRREVTIDSLDESAMPAAETQFERAWVQSVFEEALAVTRRELEASGRGPSWKLFEAYDLRDPAATKATYADLGAPHGMSEADVRNALAYVRGRLRELVVAEVRRCVADPEQLAEELGHLNLL